jgi:rSAM/selenodomain-associated transferase 1
MQKRFPLELISQRGQDLGERMLTAINQGLLTHNAIILIGSDCPFFSADYLNKAFQLLQSERDLVLGPAKDGGFVLLGANRYLPPDFFKGVIWGENTALEKTLKRADHYHFRYETLQPLQDIDRPEDLRYFQPTTSYK